MLIEIVVGTVVVVLLITFFSKIKSKSQELNDYYPFDPIHGKERK